MRTLKFFLVTTLLAAFSMQMCAQNDLLAANDNVVQSKKSKLVNYVLSNRLKDDLTVPSKTTGGMKSMTEINNFSMKSEDVKLLNKNVKKLSAKKESPDCCRVESNSAPFNQIARVWTLVYWQPVLSGLTIEKSIP